MGREKLKCLEKILVHFHFIQYKSRMFCCGLLSEKPVNTYLSYGAENVNT